MTATTPMTRRELLDLAALDALGLLDEYEAALYTRSFHLAPAAVQDEVIELQARVATELAQFSDEEPNPSLRSRVLDYVSRTIERESTAFAPLATIGRPQRHRGASADVAGRIGAAAGAMMFWRVAVFVLCAVTVVLGYTLTRAWHAHHEIAKAALSDTTRAQIEQHIGPTAKRYLFDASARHVVLKPLQADAAGRVAIYTDEALQRGLLITEGLDDVPYELRVSDERGELHVVAVIDGGRALDGTRIELAKLRLTDGARWELSGPTGVVFASA
jgi:hypothetical protein